MQGYLARERLPPLWDHHRALSIQEEALFKIVRFSDNFSNFVFLESKSCFLSIKIF